MNASETLFYLPVCTLADVLTVIFAVGLATNI